MHYVQKPPQHNRFAVFIAVVVLYMKRYKRNIKEYLSNQRQIGADFPSITYRSNGGKAQHAPHVPWFLIAGMQADDVRFIWWQAHLMTEQVECFVKAGGGYLTDDG